MTIFNFYQLLTKSILRYRLKVFTKINKAKIKPSLKEVYKIKILQLNY